MGKNKKIRKLAKEAIELRVALMNAEKEIRTLVLFPDSNDAIFIKLRTKLDHDIEKMIWS